MLKLGDQKRLVARSIVNIKSFVSIFHTRKCGSFSKGVSSISSSLVSSSVGSIVAGENVLLGGEHNFRNLAAKASNRRDI